MTDEPTKKSVVIDPANPPEQVWPNSNVKKNQANNISRVVPVLQSQIKDGKIDLTAIVNTHQYVPINAYILFIGPDQND